MKKIWGVFVLIALLSMLVVACGGGGGTTGGGGTHGGNTVNLDASSFSPASIPIQKGQSVTLSNQSGVLHIIANGSWNSSNVAEPKTEPGAPVVSNKTVNNGETYTIGPFDTAGTYHYYCSVHPGMNLTVTVS